MMMMMAIMVMVVMMAKTIIMTVMTEAWAAMNSGRSMPKRE
jgi:hypothetical protein